MQEQRAPPFGPDSRLAPLYDAALSLMSREGRWRLALAEQVAPEPHDIVLDVCCGAGALSLLLARMQPDAAIVGYDTRAALVDQARSRAREAGATASFVHSDLRDGGAHAAPLPPTKIVLTLVNARTTAQKLTHMQHARQIIDPAGVLHVADFAPQRAGMMQRLLSAPLETVFGGEVRPSHAPAGETAALIRAAGFVAVEETAMWPTPSGVVSLYRARAS